MIRINCPICNSNTSFFTEKIDRFKQKYEYFICKKCRFLFERDLAVNSKELQKKVSKIYQKDYFQNIDSGWKNRGVGFLKFLRLFLNLYKFLSFKKNISVLDYGGGNGYIASKISQNFDVFYFDKYEKPDILGKYKILEKPIKTDIVYAVELVEHITDINEWNFLKELYPDVFIFTTGLSDNINYKEISDLPYLNSDAGHVAVYSYKSLYLLGQRYGFMYLFFPNISCHIFLRNKFLSKINFVKIEYFIYSIFRKIKHVLI